MPMLLEERLLFIFVLLSVPSLVYALERLFKRKVYNRKIVIFIYVFMSLFYFDIIEKYYRDIYEEIYKEIRLEEQTSGNIKNQELSNTTQ